MRVLNINLRPCHEFIQALLPKCYTWAIWLRCAVRKVAHFNMVNISITIRVAYHV
jgi:hypothetical protein